MQDLAAQAVPAWSSSAGLASAVWFRDVLDPPGQLALQLARGRRGTEWFWKRAVVGWRDDFTQAEGLRFALKAAARLNPARPAVARLMTTLMNAGRLDCLLEILQGTDGEELLALFGVSKNWMDQNPFGSGHKICSFFPCLQGVWSRLLERWADRWGEGDDRTAWLTAVALWIHGPPQAESLLNLSSWLPGSKRPLSENPSGDFPEPLPFTAWDSLMEFARNQTSVWAMAPTQSSFPPSNFDVDQARKAKTADAVVMTRGHEERSIPWRIKTEEVVKDVSEKGSAESLPEDLSFGERDVGTHARTPALTKVKGEEDWKLIDRDYFPSKRSLKKTSKIWQGRLPNACHVLHEDEKASKENGVIPEDSAFASKARPDGTIGFPTAQSFGSAKEAHTMRQMSRNQGSFQLEPNRGHSDGMGTNPDQPVPNPLFHDAQRTCFAGFLFLLGLFRPLALDELFCRHLYFGAVAAGMRFLDSMARLLPLPEDDPHHRVLPQNMAEQQKDRWNVGLETPSFQNDIAFYAPQGTFWGQTLPLPVPSGQQLIPLFEPPSSWRRVLTECPETRRRLGLQVLDLEEGVRLLVNQTRRLVFGVSTVLGKTRRATGSTPWVLLSEQKGLQHRILEGVFRAARLVCSLYLWRREGLTFRKMAQRPGRMIVGPTHVDVFLPLHQLDVRIRRLGLDVNPGWVPWLARVVSFHYGD